MSIIDEKKIQALDDSDLEDINGGAAGCQAGNQAGNHAGNAPIAAYGNQAGNAPIAAYGNQQANAYCGAGPHGPQGGPAGTKGKLVGYCATCGCPVYQSEMHKHKGHNIVTGGAR